MIELVPLCKMHVDLAPALSVGTGPAGDRSIGGIVAVDVTGDRLSASLAGLAAADWLVRTGPIGVVDARLVLRTHDDALIYMSYGGRLDLSNLKAGIVATVAPVFETGHEAYAWINAVQAVGKSQITLTTDGGGSLDYEFFEVR